MKILIECDSDLDSGREYLELSDLDNDAFVDISYEEVNVSVSLNDLMSAVIALDSKRSKRLADSEYLK
jgi:hypothetical protein